VKADIDEAGTSGTPPLRRHVVKGPAKARVEAFSDGVFAIAITLLVLDVTLDHHSARGELWSDLIGLKFHYGAYAVSFLTIGIMWVSHHHMMTNVETVDHALLYRNLFLLAVVGFLPFPTSILADYVQGEGADNMRAAVGLYGISLTILSVAFMLLWIHIYRTPEIRPSSVTQADVRTDTSRACMSFLVDVVATALSPIAPWATLGLFATLVIVYAVVRPRSRAGRSSG
jgi:uncharacterized membrane protein